MVAGWIAGAERRKISKSSASGCFFLALFLAALASAAMAADVPATDLPGSSAIGQLLMRLGDPDAPLAEPVEPVKKEPIPATSKQALLVLSENDDAKIAVLQRFARPNPEKPWKPIGREIPVVLGKKGMAWGVGLHEIPFAAAYRKAEGDGRSPMGIFALGPAFGYATARVAAETGVRIAYLALNERHFWVDDRNSNWYNRLVDRAPGASVNWKSAETMRRSDDLYRWGLVVGHNRPCPLGIATFPEVPPDPQPFRLPRQGPVPTDTPIPGAGSAIFMHIWRSPDSGTAGCTAMTGDEMRELLVWLDPKADPVLVQFTRPAYKEWREKWKLP